MELLVLDSNFVAASLFDYFESVIWTDRYSEAGDFEVYTPMSSEILESVKPGNYVYSKHSEHMMIVERIEISSDPEDGDKLLIAGRSLESILDRRIVWTQTNLSGSVQNGVQKLLNDAIINPSDPNRKIDNFIFQASTDQRIIDLTFEEDVQYTGITLYEIITSLCKTYKIGFKIILDNDNNFIFSLYKGLDRTYDQSDRSYVIFSESFDNLSDSNYIQNYEEYKNVVLVAGEGNGVNKLTESYGDVTGLDRRELYYEATDVSQSTVGILSTDEYKALLKSRGEEILEDYRVAESFEGQIDAVGQFVYGTDFGMGDIVQVVNAYGIDAKSTIIELVMSQNTDTIDFYPTFEIVEE